MKKANRIRLSFILGTFFCIGGYFAGYHYVTGTYPEEIKAIPEMITDKSQEEKTDTGNEKKETESATESAAIQKNFEYVIVEEDGYLTVYHADLKTKYMDTDISMEELDDDIKASVQNGKKFENAEELYSFLENYSS